MAGVDSYERVALLTHVEIATLWPISGLPSAEVDATFSARLEPRPSRYWKSTWYQIIPEGLSIHRQDRTINSGKSKGGGVCFMVNNKWCPDVEIISTGCSPDLEHLMIRCRPYYLPREFTSVVMTAVYLPPHADNNKAMDELFGVIDRTETSRPEAAFIVAGRL
ncbi:hypothetical protein L3Q82_019239 [Scortum barcoo]|uniref:Uncharacterized protein n=1 Tax=Scortum barcoo TaxID=214431 RepID=A0ACB8VBN2_9TELE|nr:hypothetical protein L3Q82_019239 [Scortum barcoo]